MRDPLFGIRLKRRRAWDQIKSLESEIRSYLATEPYQPAVNFDIPTRILTATVAIQSVPPPMWGVYIGEIAHNLRSALDHLVWELRILSRRQPPTLPTKLQFPIFKTEDGFDKRGVPVQLANVGKYLVAMMKEEQPFATGENLDSPLWHLAELSNADKHRTLHVTGALLQKWEIKLTAGEDMVRQELEVRQEGPIQQDAVLYRAHFTGKRPFPFADPNAHGHLATSVAFDRATPAVGGWLVLDTLDLIANRTDRILSRFAKDVFKTEL